jgi:hypothetical protein
MNLTNAFSVIFLELAKRFPLVGSLLDLFHKAETAIHLPHAGRLTTWR